MTEPSLHYITCPDYTSNAAGVPTPLETTHRMAYWQWGSATAEHTVLCVHGLTRQGRDFDVLAQSLLERAKGDQGNLRVICPDVVGRGKSDWLADPMGYQVPQYAADMLALLTHLQPKVLDWVGTSMGGLIGIVVNAHAARVGLQIRRLVLNDVGPVLQWASLQRIGAYVGQSMRFASLEQAAAAMWSISTSFGPHTPEQWLALSRHMVKPIADNSGASTGAVTLHYDPALALPFKAVTQEMAQHNEALLWQLYDGIAAPTLLLRGADSDLLSLDTAQRMTERGPKAQLREFAGVGHAPTLIAPEQRQAVVDFLLG